MGSVFWTGPAFLSGHGIPVVNGLGQTAPSDFQTELNSYRDQASQLPPDIGAPILKTLDSCQVFLVPEHFVPMRIRGCLNSVLAQLRAAGIQA